MQTALIVTALIIGTYFVLATIAKSRMKNLPVVTDHKNILVLDDKNFKNQLKNKVVLVDFWASWCAPCRMMAPVLNEVAANSQSKYYVGKVNVEISKSLASDYKIRSIPTMVLFKNGREVNRFVGIKSKEFLMKQLDNTK